MNNSGTRLVIFFTVLFIAAIVFAIFKPDKGINLDDLEPRYGVGPRPPDTLVQIFDAPDSTILPVPVPVNKTGVQQDPGSDFYIIIGSSKSYDLAEKRAETLKKRYGAEIFVLPVSKEGLYRISFGRYRTRGEADSKLQSVRSVAGPDAWIYFMQ